MHAGAKFSQDAYKVSGGLHGVGVSVVNALSSYLKAEVKRDGFLYEQVYFRGRPKGKVKKVKKVKGTGTIITFQPDKDIFGDIKFSLKTILSHLRQQAYLTAGIKIQINDYREGKNFSYTFYFEGGLRSFVRYLNRTNKPISEDIFYTCKEVDKIFVEIALRYVEGYKETVLGFANNIHTTDGGTHLVGFRSALTRTLNSYARAMGIIKEKGVNLSGDDTREGLTALISVRLPSPQFEGQTKARLGNEEVRSAVDRVFSQSFKIYLEEHPKFAEAVINKCLLTLKARRAAKAARETVLRKGVMESFALPGKLADCSSKDPRISELYIVEGDSAGGSARQGRNPEFQAILPLRGKILNAERTRIEKILSNEELKALIIALGTNIGEQFDIDKLRYHKIITMTDADVDGLHIRTLLLTFFWRYFPQLIEGGYIYIACPPLYRISCKGKKYYVYSDEEKEKLLIKLGKSKSGSSQDKSKKGQFQVKKLEEKTSSSLEKVTIQRYKGLGEMNPDELYETTMDPEKRVLKLVTVEDAAEADEIFEILMGKDVEARKHFIQVYAKQAENIDI